MAASIPAGLENASNTCYLNSIIQAWFNDEVFRRAFYNVSVLEAGSPVIFNIQMLFRDMEVNRNGRANARRLIAALGINANEQNDPTEFYLLLSQAVDAEIVADMANAAVSPGIVDLNTVLGNRTSFSTLLSRVCTFCGHAPTETQTHGELHLHPKRNESLEDLLARYMEPDIEEKVECGGCFVGKGTEKDRRKSSRPSTLPNVLRLTIQRAEGTLLPSGAYVTRKTKHQLGFPLSVNLAYLLPNGNNHTAVLYDLVAVLEHEGSAEGGHYVAKFHEEQSGIWYYASDTNVVEDDALKALKALHHAQGVFTSKSAYCLFYRKRDDLMAALPVVLPQELRDRPRSVGVVPNPRETPFQREARLRQEREEQEAREKAEEDRRAAAAAASLAAAQGQQGGNHASTSNLPPTTSSASHLPSLPSANPPRQATNVSTSYTTHPRNASTDAAEKEGYKPPRKKKASLEAAMEKIRLTEDWKDASNFVGDTSIDEVISKYAITGMKYDKSLVEDVVDYECDYRVQEGVMLQLRMDDPDIRSHFYQTIASVMPEEEAEAVTKALRTLVKQPRRVCSEQEEFDALARREKVIRRIRRIAKANGRDGIILLAYVGPADTGDALVLGNWPPFGPYQERHNLSDAALARQLRPALQAYYAFPLLTSVKSETSEINKRRGIGKRSKFPAIDLEPFVTSVSETGNNPLRNLGRGATRCMAEHVAELLAAAIAKGGSVHLASAGSLHIYYDQLVRRTKRAPIKGVTVTSYEIPLNMLSSHPQLVTPIKIWVARTFSSDACVVIFKDYSPCYWGMQWPNIDQRIESSASNRCFRAFAIKEGDKIITDKQAHAVFRERAIKRTDETVVIAHAKQLRDAIAWEEKHQKEADLARYPILRVYARKNRVALTAISTESLPGLKSAVQRIYYLWLQAMKVKRNVRVWAPALKNFLALNPGASLKELRNFNTAMANDIAPCLDLQSFKTKRSLTVNNHLSDLQILSYELSEQITDAGVQSRIDEFGEEWDGVEQEADALELSSEAKSAMQDILLKYGKSVMIWPDTIYGQVEALRTVLESRQRRKTYSLWYSKTAKSRALRRRVKREDRRNRLFCTMCWRTFQMAAGLSRHAHEHEEALVRFPWPVEQYEKNRWRRRTDNALPGQVIAELKELLAQHLAQEDKDQQHESTACGWCALGLPPTPVVVASSSLKTSKTAAKTLTKAKGKSRAATDDAIESGAEEAPNDNPLHYTIDDNNKKNPYICKAITDDGDECNWKTANEAALAIHYTKAHVKKWPTIEVNGVLLDRRIVCAECMETFNSASVRLQHGQAQGHDSAFEGAGTWSEAQRAGKAKLFESQKILVDGELVARSLICHQCREVFGSRFKKQAHARKTKHKHTWPKT